jgi:hypothetical protein
MSVIRVRPSRRIKGKISVALNVIISNPVQSVGDWATARNLALNSTVGQFAAPAGAYGAFAVNGSRTQ